MPKEFNVGGQWTANQSGGWQVTFVLTQSRPNPPAPADERTALSGSARASNPNVGTMSADRVEGRVARGPGAVGQQFNLNVFWNNGSRGVYTGTFDVNKRLTGNTFDQAHPNNVASWVSVGTFQTFDQ